ncbi:MAG TPA: AMP-binding protein, partial [Pseudonocardiaceae bacterium]|nr:AMP-binding protein [Pseudonocardiaceae bacterium]
LPTGTSRFDLRWYMEEVDDGLEGFLEFATDLFSADLAAALVNDFQETLARLSGVRDTVGTPAVAIAEPDAEQTAQLVSSLFPAPAGDDRFEPAHVLFERHAVERPDHPAVWHDGTELSYRQLDRMADRVAGLLRDTGIHREELVGVHVERAADRVAAVLGVLKAGGACVLLDPDTDPPVGLVSRTLLDQAGHSVTVVPPPDEPIHRESAGACAVMVDQLACVGSGPALDGVELTHRGLAGSITGAARAFGIDSGTRLLSGAPGDLLTVWQMLVALGSGATLCLPSSGGTEWSSLSTAATASGADVVCVAAPVLTAAEPTSMPGVRLLVTSGERLMRGVRDRWLPHCRMIAAYGCGAGTPVQTWGRCEAGGAVRPLLGRPLDGVRVYVLDHALRPVPCGAIGEIYVGGPTIGRGYHGRPARTAERYLPDPYAPAPGGRMLRTGDLCLRTVDGRLEFAGRVDHQVTIRGFHVELEEVVAALRALPSVADAAVRVERTPNGRRELVGYLVLDRTAADAGIEARLRKSLHTGLPAGMVPSRLLTVPAIPVTPTGDVDTETLRLLADTGVTSVADVLGRIDQMSDEQVHAILRVMDS